MATLLTCREVSKAFGLRELFSGLSIGFADEERIGFLGPNGAGKTTLLKILAGVEPADSGEITMRRSARVAYLPQEDRFQTDATVETVLTEAIAEEYTQPHERDTQVNIILSQFGFTQRQQRVDELSGGWRKRLALAREIIRRPDLLLMDEPTNHLDLEGIVWLENMLIRARFSFLAVSHDRYFLERVTNRVVELNPVYPDGYFSVTGPYSMFLEKRADFLEAQQAQQATLANVVRREAAFLKSHVKARRSKSKARIDEAYRLKDELRELKRRNAPATAAGIDFDGTGRRTNKLLEAKGLAKTLGDQLLFKDVSISLSPGTRLGLLGSNGCGKTTLIRVLTGDLPPDEGTVKRATGLKVVVFDQNREKLPQDMPLRRALSADSDSIQFRDQAIHITAWARRFLFRIDQLDMPVRELSGGEQARILIARLMLKPADVLVLDEPTNDLDITSLDVLEESLSEFPGAVVLVTHDRFMLDRISTDVLGFDGAGQISRYIDCEQWQAAQARQRDNIAAKDKPKRPQKRKDRNGLTASEKNELADMEDTIHEAEAYVEECRQAMGAIEEASDYVETQKRWEEIETAQERVEALYARWEELEAKAT